jgi:hypothetical protein
MTPAPSLRRARPLPCGCLCGPGVLLTLRCPEAEALWAAVQKLGDAASSLTPEWVAYRNHFKRTRKRKG